MSIGYQNHLVLTPAWRGIALLWAGWECAGLTCGRSELPAIAADARPLVRELLLGLLLCVLILLVLLTGDASY
jgi:hypothetical protein